MRNTQFTARLLASGFVIAILAAVVIAKQDPAEMPQDPDEMMAMMPTPQEEHLWLKKFVGQWDVTAEMHMPGMEEMTSTGIETVGTVGDFWITAHTNGDFSGTPYKSVLTIGYDPDKEKYVGTWIDSFSSTLWVYEGTVNEAGTTLTMHTEGRMMPGEPITKFTEVTEFKSDDHRVFTSSILGEDGEATPMVTVNYHRKK